MSTFDWERWDRLTHLSWSLSGCDLKDRRRNMVVNYINTTEHQLINDGYRSDMKLCHVCTERPPTNSNDRLYCSMFGIDCGKPEWYYGDDIAMCDRCHSDVHKRVRRFRICWVCEAEFASGNKLHRHIIQNHSSSSSTKQ